MWFNFYIEWLARGEQQQQVLVPFGKEELGEPKPQTSMVPLLRRVDGNGFWFLQELGSCGVARKGYLVVAERQNVGDLGIEQRVDDGEDAREDDRRLGQVLVQHTHLVLVRRVLDQRRQHRQHQRLPTKKKIR